MAMIASVDSQTAQKYSSFTQTKKHIHSIMLNILHHDILSTYQIFNVTFIILKLNLK